MTAGVNNQLQGGYKYDAAGNMTHDATASLDYGYDPENRIKGAAGFAYSYDADGNRVEKSNGATGTLYWYMTPGIVAESDLAGNLKSEYVFFNGERVARKDFPSNAVSYYFSDHLKTASVITDSAGNIKSESDYSPWGRELSFFSNDSNPYKFGGHELDGETGNYDYGARYYSPAFSRFLTPDWSAAPVPVPYADLTNPQSLNLYGYVGGNPASKADPDGHCWPLSACADKLDSYIQVFRDDGLVANKLASSPDTVFANTFANGVTADLAQGFTNILRLGQSVGELPSGASTADKIVAASEEGGRVGAIILTVVGAAGAKAPATAAEGAQVAADVGRSRVITNSGSAVDLQGKAHAGVKTPHIKDPTFNTNPKTGQVFQNKFGLVRPATVGDVNAAAKAAGVPPAVRIPPPLPVPQKRKDDH